MQQSLKTTVLANRFITMKELVDQFSVDRKTIIKVLKKFDLNRRVARKVPFLKDDQRERRQIWAQKMNRKTVSFWKRTIFSDEVRFSQFSDSRRSYCFRSHGEEFEEKCTSKTVKYPGSVIGRDLL